MATSLEPSVEKAYHLRVQALLVDGGTLVLRSLIKDKYQGTQWNAFLNRHHIRNKVIDLRDRNVRSQQQHALLYPRGCTTDISNYDISLLVCVLRSLLYPHTSANFWNITPLSTDFSEQADIIRLSKGRNKLAHSTSASMTKQQFKAQWTYLEQVLLRLARNIPDLKEKINKLRKESIDPENEKELKEIIKMWEESDKASQQEIQEVKSKLQEHDHKLLSRGLRLTALEQRIKDENGESNASREKHDVTTWIHNVQWRWEDLDDRRLLDLTRFIGPNWDLAMDGFGLTPTEVWQCKQDNLTSVRTQILHALRKWRNKANDPHLENFVTILSTCDKVSVEWDNLKDYALDL